MQIRRSADHKHMPWKNGGGVTVEIAIHPANASVDNFDWRISTASVANDGAFSTFPGIDRTLSVLDGNGIVLTVEGLETTLTRETAPFAFAADARSDARLLDGAMTDLNVMTRRDTYCHHVKRIEINDKAHMSIDGGTCLIFCAAGHLQVTDGGEAVTLQSRDCLLFGEDCGATLVLEGEALLYLIEISKPPR